MRILIFALVALLAVGAGCQSFENSQRLQNLVMLQVRDEWVKHHETLTGQIAKDKAALIVQAWRASLKMAVGEDGKIALAAVLEKDAKRQVLEDEVKANLVALDGEFQERIDLLDRGIALGTFTLDAMSQWSRAAKSLQGVFERAPELAAAEEAASGEWVLAEPPG